MLELAYNSDKAGAEEELPTERWVDGNMRIKLATRRGMSRSAVWRISPVLKRCLGSVYSLEIRRNGFSF